MIVITGGAGFIGSAFAKKCNKMGIEDLIIVDSLHESEKWKNLVHLKYMDYIDKTDFLDLLVDDGLPSGVQAIVHMGACSATTEENMDYLMDNNYRYTRFLADWCVENKVRFIYASSAATYGDGKQGFLDDHNGLDDLIPINRYGYSKHLFDLYAKNQGYLDKIVGLKFFNVFGPNEYHKGSMMSVACKAYSEIKNTGKIHLFKSYKNDFANGDQCRDFVYVKDCVEIMWWLLKTPNVNGILNIGSGKARTWNDLAQALFSAMKKTADIQYIDMPENIRAHYQYKTQASLSKLKAYKCPVSMTSLEHAVEDYITYLERGEFL